MRAIAGQIWLRMGNAAVTIDKAEINLAFKWWSSGQAARQQCKAQLIYARK